MRSESSLIKSTIISALSINHTYTVWIITQSLTHHPCAFNKPLTNLSISTSSRVLHQHLPNKSSSHPPHAQWTIHSSPCPAQDLSPLLNGNLAWLVANAWGSHHILESSLLKPNSSSLLLTHFARSECLLIDCAWTLTSPTHSLTHHAQTSQPAQNPLCALSSVPSLS